MVTPLVGIGHRVVPYVVVEVAVALGQAGGRSLLHSAQVVLGSECRGTCGRIVVAVAGAEVPLLGNEVELCIEVAQHLVVLVLRIEQLGGGYWIVEVVAYADGVRAGITVGVDVGGRLVIHGEDAGHVECLLPGCIVGQYLGALTEHAVHAYGEPVEGLVLKVAAEVKARIVVVGIHDTVLIEVAHAHAVVGLVGTAADVQAVVGDHRCAKQFVVPVGIRIVLVLLEVATVLGHTGLQHWQIIGNFALAQHLCILARIAHLEHVGGLLYAYVAVVRHLGAFVVLAFLRGDDYHTVGSTYTVDGAGAGILHDAHLLDVAVVKEVDVVVEHSIHHVEWGSVAERTQTTDGHRRSAARHTAVHDVHTGNLALQGCHGRRGRHADDVRCLHRLDGCGQVLRLGSAVTDHHGLLKVLHVGRHADVHRSALDLHVLCRHAKVGAGQCGIRGHTVEFVVAVIVSGGHDVGTCHAYYSTQQWFAELIEHATLHLAQALCHHRHGDHSKDKQ